jgi:hypothetical protein
VALVKRQAMAHPTMLGSFYSQQQRGFGYLAVLLIVLMLAVALGTTFERIDTVMKREREQEWFFAGKQYQQAIASYYNKSPNGIKELPTSVDDLLLDRRFVSAVRHLRKRFADPITGGDWTLVIDENQKIKGVYSESDLPILQTAQFTMGAAENSEQAPTYADIKFEFTPVAKEPEQASENAPEQDVLQNQTTLE